MTSGIHEIEEKALKLSAHERALLAEHLINSLDECNDADSERLWQDEAERRYKEYKDGELKAKPSFLVFEEAFKKFS